MDEARAKKVVGDMIVPLVNGDFVSVDDEFAAVV